MLIFRSELAVQIFKVRVFNRFARCYFHTQLSRCFQHRKHEKQREYEHAMNLKEKVRENLIFVNGLSSYW